MKRKKNIISKAGVLLIAVFMICSVIPTVMADTDDISISNFTEQKLTLESPTKNKHDFNDIRATLTGVENLDQSKAFGGVGSGPIIYNNGANVGTAVASQYAANYPFNAQTADDFILLQSVSIADVHWWGGFWSGGPVNPCGFNIYIYADDGTGNAPTGGGLSNPETTALASYSFPGVTGTLDGGDYEYEVDLSPPFSASAGVKYWLVIQADLDFPPQYGWIETAGYSNSPAVQGFPALGLPFWSDTSGGNDMAFYLTGTSGPGPEGDCKEDQCDFAIDGFTAEFEAKHSDIDINNDGIIDYWAFNSEPKELCIDIANLGDIGIGELKLLADVYEKICGETVIIWDDYKYDIQQFPCCGSDYPFEFPDSGYTPIGDEPTDPEDRWSVTDDTDGDSWALQGGEDNRWLTNNQAWRCTKGEDRSFGTDADVYLGLSDTAPKGVYDNLTTPEFNVTGAACAEISFSHWCEGEYVIDEDGCIVPTDYGTIAYSIDAGATWTEIGSEAGNQKFVAYDTNGEWQEVNLKFINTEIDANDADYMHSYNMVCGDCEPEEGDIVIMDNLTDGILQLKFIWHKDPCLQYEGWYVDDFEVTMTLDYELELTCQTHEIIGMGPCEGNVSWTGSGENGEFVNGDAGGKYCFPLPCDFEDDTWYEVVILGQVFGPSCEQEFGNNEFKFQFKIMDIHDIRCHNMSFSDGSTEKTVVIDDEEVSVPVTVWIENVGTFAEPREKIKVNLEKGDIVKNVLANDHFEADSLGDYSIYYFNLPGGPTNVPWRWSKGDASISNIYTNDESQARSRNPGMECLVGAEKGSYPTVIEDTFSIIAPAGTIDLDPNNNWVESGYEADCGDPCDAEISWEMKWSIEPGGMALGFALMPTEGPLAGYVVWWTYGLSAFTYTNDWVSFDMNYDYLVDIFEQMSVKNTDPIIDDCTGEELTYDYLPECEFGLFVAADGPAIEDWYPGFMSGTPNGGTYNPSNPVPWTGVLIDNWYLSVSDVGETEIVATGTIENEELLPGEKAKVELAWDNVELCQHGLVADVNLEGDINPGNDECCVLTVTAHQEEYCFDSYIEDLTSGGDCHWHACTNREGGDDYFAWSGVESEHSAQYINNMDEGLVSPTIDLSYDKPTYFAVNFTTYYDFAAPSSSNEWQVCLLDSYGDGWDTGYGGPNTLDIYVDGTLVLDGIYLADGYGPECYTFTVESGDTIEADYTAVGSFPEEDEYIIYDSEGNVVTDQGASGIPGDWSGTVAVDVVDFVEVDIWKTFDHDNDSDTANITKWVEIGKLTGSSGGVFVDESFIVDTSTMNNDRTKVRFRMVSDEEGVSEGCYIDDFRIVNVTQVIDPSTEMILYDNDLGAGDGLGSSQYDTTGFVSELADDFVLTDAGVVTEIDFIAGYWNGAPVPDPWTVTIYGDSGGMPDDGTIYYSNTFTDAELTQTPASGYTLYEATPAPSIALSAGTYWISVQGVTDFPPQTGFGIHASPIKTSESMFKSAYFGFPTWTSSGAVFGANVDAAFQLMTAGYAPMYHEDLPVLTWMDDQDDIDDYPSDLVELPDYPYINMEGIGSDHPCWDTFERGFIAPWSCVPSSAGNWWMQSEDNATLPNDEEDIGHDPCEPCNVGWYTIPSENLVPYGYPATGTGINNAIAFMLDLTDETLNQEYVQFCAQINYELDQESVFIEFSPDWEPGTPMESATWVKYWAHTPGDSYGDDTDGWITLEELTKFDDDNRWIIDEYIGEKVAVRFRLQTEGNGAGIGDGFAVDDIHLKLKHTVGAFVDEVPPQTSIFFDPLTGFVQLSPIDFPEGKASGVAATYYKIDGGEQQQGREFTIPEGTHTVEYWSVDNNDNEESHKTATFTVDTTAPTIELTSPEEGKIYFLGNPIFNRILSDKTLCIGTVPIAANATDEGSGVSMVIFTLSNGDSGVDNDGAPYDYTFRGMHFGELTISAVAIDGNGLVSSPDEITIMCYSFGLL